MSKYELNKELINEIMDRWAKITANESEQRPHIPLKVLLGEAVDLAELVEQHFANVVVNGKMRLGLESFIGRGGISAKTSTELRELQLAAANAQSRYVVLVEQTSNAPLEKAEDILSELRATLGFLLTDGSNATGALQFNRLRDEYDDVTTHDGLALALEGYAELANQYRTQLETLAGFDTELISEAVQVALALRQRSADRLTGLVTQEQRDLMRLRNRLASALSTRMTEVRRTIRFVFRDYPEIVRKAGSEYMRNGKRNTRLREASDSGVNATDETMPGMAAPEAKMPGESNAAQ